LGYVPVIGEQISSFGKFADAAKSFSTELAPLGPSLRSWRIGKMRYKDEAAAAAMALVAGVLG
jgi:hypothetical protein